MFYKRVLVISDNPGITDRFKKIIEKKNLSDFTFRRTILSKAEYEENLNNNQNFIDLKNEADIQFIIDSYDLVISLHCKQLFPVRLIKNIKCINVHPGYNPINRGWFPQVFSIIHQFDIGATIHEIDEELDHGDIIVREKVEKEDWDTSSSLYQKVVDKEVELLEKNIESILLNTYTTIKPESEGNLYLKKDFNRLKEINLDEKVSFKECIDFLRAMTFEGYDNCFFKTATGVKVYVSISLKPEAKQ